MGSKQDVEARPNELAVIEHALLTTSPPVVTGDEAAHVAAHYFGAVGSCDSLSGERDRNFRAKLPEGSSFTLKFINDAETDSETVMQIAVLKHLESRSQVPVPAHIAPMHTDGQDWAVWQAANGEHVRVRAYSFLEGKPGINLLKTEDAWRSVGEVAAKIDAALADFTHPAATREFLWDACQAPGLREWLDVVDDVEQRRDISNFLSCFEDRLAQHLPALPCQVIHNDLSPSNILLGQDSSTVTGVLDFGDMVYAPRIAEAAIAASYHMANADDPLHMLSCLLDGYHAVLPLTALEREQALDFVIARLTQRMVITSRRALQFPSNRDYILRSQAAASHLFDELIEPWQTGVVL